MDLLVRTVVGRFLAAHPNVELRLISAHPRSQGRIEATLSLWFETLPRESEFGIKLGEVPYAVYCAATADPERLGWVSFHDEDAPRLATTRTLARLRRSGESLRLTTSDTATLVSAVVAGIGKGLLPMCLAAPRAELRRLASGPPEVSRTLNLHLHPDGVQTARVQATIRWLRESVEEVFGHMDVAMSAEVTWGNPRGGVACP